MSTQFIVLEGPDGSGTTLHTALLAKRLRAQGIDVVETCEPTPGPIGVFIREHLKANTLPPDALQLLFTADRAWHLTHEVLPALERGATVISDRYWLSTIVYAEALGVDPSGLALVNEKFRTPDLQLLLLPPFEVCQERLGRRTERDILEENTLQKKVYDIYKKRADEYGINIIDSSGDKEATADAIFSLTL